MRLLLSDLSASLSLQYTLYVIPYQSMSKHVNLLLESETSNGILYASRISFFFFKSKMSDAYKKKNIAGRKSKN